MNSLETNQNIWKTSPRLLFFHCRKSIPFKSIFDGNRCSDLLGVGFIGRESIRIRRLARNQRNTRRLQGESGELQPLAAYGARFPSGQIEFAVAVVVVVVQPRDTPHTNISLSLLPGETSFWRETTAFLAVVLASCGGSAFSVHISLCSLNFY